MQAGDTFLLPDRHGMRHLYVVISDPQNLSDIRFPGHVFIVALSSLESWKEDCCVLQSGDHPFLTHSTVAVYKIPPAAFLPLAQLQALKDQGRAVEKEPVSSVVLKRLRDGYLLSNYERDDIKQFLFRQGVID